VCRRMAKSCWAATSPRWAANGAPTRPAHSSGALDDGFRPNDTRARVQPVGAAGWEDPCGRDLHSLGGFARNGVGSSILTARRMRPSVPSRGLLPIGRKPRRAAGRKILAGGTFDSHLMRFTPDGNLDLDFNVYCDSNVKCLAVQPDAKIIVGVASLSWAATPRRHWAPNADGNTG